MLIFVSGKDVGKLDLYQTRFINEHRDDQRPQLIKKEDDLLSLELSLENRNQLYPRKTDSVVGIWHRIRELSISNFQSHLNLIHKRSNSAGSDKLQTCYQNFKSPCDVINNANQLEEQDHIYGTLNNDPM